MSSQSKRLYSVRSRLNNDSEEQQCKNNNFNDKFRSRRNNFEDSHDRRDEKPKEIGEFKDLRQLLNSRRNKANVASTEKVDVSSRFSSRLEKNEAVRNDLEKVTRPTTRANQNSFNFIKKSLNLTKTEHCDRTLKVHEEITQRDDKIETTEKKEEKIRKPVRIRNPAGRLADLVRLQVVDAVQKNQKQISSSSSSHKSNSQESLIEISSESSLKTNEDALKSSLSSSSESLDKSGSKDVKTTLKDFLLSQNIEKLSKDSENWLDMIDDEEVKNKKLSEDKKEQKFSHLQHNDSKPLKIENQTTEKQILTKSSSENVLNSHKNEQKPLNNSSEQIMKTNSFSNNFKEFYPRNYRSKDLNAKFSGSLSDENVNLAQFSNQIYQSSSQNSILPQHIQSFPTHFNFPPPNYQQVPQVQQNFYQIPPQISIPSYDAQNFNNFSPLPLISPTFSNRSESPTNSISSLTGGPSKLEARLKKIRGNEEKKVKEILKPQPQFSPQNLENFDRNYQNHENLITVPIQSLSPKIETQKLSEEFKISHHEFNLNPFVNEKELKIKLDCDIVEPTVKETTVNEKLTHDQFINLNYVTTLVPKYFGEAMNYYLEYYEELGIKLNQNEVENVLKLRGKEHKTNDKGIKILG